MLPASNRFARKATENHTGKVHLGSSLEMWLCVYKHPKTVEKISSWGSRALAPRPLTTFPDGMECGKQRTGILTIHATL